MPVYSHRIAVLELKVWSNSPPPITHYPPYLPPLIELS